MKRSSLLILYISYIMHVLCDLAASNQMNINRNQAYELGNGGKLMMRNGCVCETNSNADQPISQQNGLQNSAMPIHFNTYANNGQLTFGYTNRMVQQSNCDCHYGQPISYENADSGQQSIKTLSGSARRPAGLKNQLYQKPTSSSSSSSSTQTLSISLPISQLNTYKPQSNTNRQNSNVALRRPPSVNRMKQKQFQPAPIRQNPYGSYDQEYSLNKNDFDFNTMSAYNNRLPGQANRNNQPIKLTMTGQRPMNNNFFQRSPVNDRKNPRNRVQQEYEPNLVPMFAFNANQSPLNKRSPGNAYGMKSYATNNANVRYSSQNRYHNGRNQAQAQVQHYSRQPGTTNRVGYGNKQSSQHRIPPSRPEFVNEQSPIAAQFNSNRNYDGQSNIKVPRDYEMSNREASTSGHYYGYYLPQSSDRPSIDSMNAKINRLSAVSAQYNRHDRLNTRENVNQHFRPTITDERPVKRVDNDCYELNDYDYETISSVQHNKHDEKQMIRVACHSKPGRTFYFSNDEE